MSVNFVGILVLVVVGIVLAFAFAGGGSKSDDVPLELTDADILREAKEGRKIQAIKWYRSLYGVGLKDAKEAVEKMLEGK